MSSGADGEPSSGGRHSLAVNYSVVTVLWLHCSVVAVLLQCCYSDSAATVLCMCCVCLVYVCRPAGGESWGPSWGRHSLATDRTGVASDKEPRTSGEMGEKETSRGGASIW
jgi:hypothetical protein